MTGIIFTSMNELLTTTQVAEMHGVTRQTVGHWVRQGLIEAQRLGNGQRPRVMIARSVAEAFTRPPMGPRPVSSSQVLPVRSFVA